MVLAELGGFRFQTRLQKDSASEVGYALALCQQLGTPVVPELTSLPLWRPLMPKFHRRPWPGALALQLGPPGIDILEAMLAWAPRLRPQAFSASCGHCTYPRTYVRTYVRPTLPLA